MEETKKKLTPEMVEWCTTINSYCPQCKYAKECPMCKLEFEGSGRRDEYLAAPVLRADKKRDPVLRCLC